MLGELLAGVVIGPGGFGLVQESEVIHAVAELGVLILLFEVGLESDLGGPLRAGPQATLVAVVGVALLFAAGFGVMQALGHPPLLAVFVGATSPRPASASPRGCSPTWAGSRTGPLLSCSAPRSWTTSWA